MAEAKNGSRVRVHYTGTLNDGRVFDSTEGRDPIEFTLGQGQVIPGFEQAITGMQEGQSKQFTLSPDQAYGPRRNEMVMEIDRQRVPPDFHPQAGQRIELRSADGHTLPATIVEVTPDVVRVDANHPLAGEELNFEIELVEVV